MNSIVHWLLWQLHISMEFRPKSTEETGWKVHLASLGTPKSFFSKTRCSDTLIENNWKNQGEVDGGMGDLGDRGKGAHLWWAPGDAQNG